MLTVHEMGTIGGRPMVALHGLRGHGRRWRFLTGFHVYGLDIRGHGHSPSLPPWTLEQHADDVLRTMDVLGVQDVDIVGISFGGAVALHVASQAPQRVRRLITFDPAVNISSSTALEMARAAISVPSFQNESDAYAARSHHWPETQRETVEQEVHDHLKLCADGRWRWRYEPAAIVAAISEMTRIAPPRSLDVPSLMVLASHGSLTSEDYAQECRAAGVTVRTVNSSHQMDIDVPSVVNNMTTSFLT